MINCNINLLKHVIFYEYRNIAINNAKNLSDNKIDDKKLTTSFS